MPADEAARLVAGLADAVQAAHEKGVVHRDLKPGNVLLTAEGTPKVADFGLARRADGPRMTATGAVMGTPAYMAPEQARGKKDIGPAADVWALGVILYECLTGRVPFEGECTHDLLARVIAEEPTAPRTRNPKAPADLEAVCLKCLAKDPAERYGDAKELGVDLRRFLAGKPVEAKPRRSRSRRVWLWLVAVVLLAALVGGTAQLGRQGQRHATGRRRGPGAREGYWWRKRGGA
jgi:serine/threonine-protein kinase